MSTSKLRVHILPYFQDSAILFSLFLQDKWAVFLDSGYPLNTQGRYDIISANPITTLVTHDYVTEITHNNTTYISKENPFDLVKKYLLIEDYQINDTISDLPFVGGAIGYFAYDLARYLEKLPSIAKDEEKTPDMAVGIYQWAVIIDHQKQCSYLIGQSINESTWQQLLFRFKKINQDNLRHEAFRIIGDIQSNMTKESYLDAFKKIKQYLKEGDCYQVNLAQRFFAHYEGNPWLAYLKLREINSAPFSGYFSLPQLHILSSSPERFLKFENGFVETKPIKGTRPRKIDITEDTIQANELKTSIKDRAENLMIVDLLRNDISKTCQIGSVKVPKLFDVESYATVHHLVSTITGQLANNNHPLDLLKTCFPGGSITGAPKIRAMEIIEELEPNRRGIYCGSMGYISFNGNMDTNISIRTLICSDNIIRFWAGGGIVNDSKVEEEYQESFDKASALLNLCNSFKN